MIIAAIKSLIDAIAKTMSYSETKIEHQCESEVLKNKKKIEKKSYKQEDLIIDMGKLIYKYQNAMTKQDRMRAKLYIRRIKGVN